MEYHTNVDYFVSFVKSNVILRNFYRREKKMEEFLITKLVVVLCDINDIKEKY